MRKRTTFGELPDGAMFQFVHSSPSLPVYFKVGLILYRRSRSADHRGASSGNEVIWLDAPDDHTLEPDTPDADDAKALEQLAAEEPDLRTVIWPAEPGPMTAEQMLARWRELLAAGCALQFWPTNDGDIFCLVDSGSICVSGSDPDPLRAFEAAYRAWEEASK